MEQDQRLSPVQTGGEIKAQPQDYPTGYASYYDEGISEGARSIKQYAAVIYKRLPLILTLTILATTLAAFYMFRQPSQFTARSQMLIEPRKPKAQSRDSININFGQDANYYATQLQLLKNPDLMRKVVIKLGLYRDANLFSSQSQGLLASIGSLFSGNPNNSEQPGGSLPVISNASELSQNNELTLSPEEEARVNAYAARLVGGTSAIQRERTNIVDISVVTTNPELSAKVADTVAEVFRDDDIEREMQGAKRAAADLVRSIDELQTNIAQQELELIDEMRQSGLPLQDKGQELAHGRLAAMSATWLQSMEARRNLETRYNAAVAANARGEGASIPEIVANPIYQDAVRQSTERRSKLQDDIRSLDRQIKEAETELSTLEVKYTEHNPQVKTVVAKIDSLKNVKAEAEKEVDKIIIADKKSVEKDAVSGALVSLRSQLDSKRREEVQALAAYEKEAALANIQGQAMTKLTTLRRNIETNRNLLDSNTSRLKTLELDIQSGSPDNIKVAAYAEAPRGPSGPNRLRNIFVAFLLSFASGIGLAFLLDYLDDSVKNSEDIGRNLGLPTLALIPHYFGSEKKRLKLAAANGAANGASTGLVALSERHSPMAEAYRHLRTSLLFSSAGKPPQTILVTSSQPSEGKTTTAINTAITLAQSNAEVVLIDCDLRRPRLHQHFGMDNSQGLTNYLSGERNTQNMIKVCPDLPRLKIITSGPIPPNPAELLSSNEMKNLLQFLRGKYKHVIIDSPPAISFTDAAILSTQVDGVVLVAMAGKSSLQLMRRFKQRLGTIGARIYGVVLNGIKSNSTEYGYYGSGYYAYYGKGNDDTSTPVMGEENAADQTERQ